MLSDAFSIFQPCFTWHRSRSRTEANAFPPLKRLTALTEGAQVARAMPPMRHSTRPVAGEPTTWRRSIGRSFWRCFGAVTSCSPEVKLVLAS